MSETPERIWIDGECHYETRNPYRAHAIEYIRADLAVVSEREPDSDCSFLLRNAVTRVSELEAENVRLKARLAEAMKALEFYADPKNWTDTPSWDGDPECFTEKAIPVRMQEGAQVCDCGDTARRVREGVKEDG